MATDEEAVRAHFIRMLRERTPDHPFVKQYDRETTYETCIWCGRSRPQTEMNTLDWGGQNARVCDRCCDDSA